MQLSINGNINVLMHHCRFVYAFSATSCNIASFDICNGCRLVDEMGQPIGPFRVWLQYAWIPGLAMSRALGDAVAHS